MKKQSKKAFMILCLAYCLILSGCNFSDAVEPTITPIPTSTSIPSPTPLPYPSEIPVKIDVGGIVWCGLEGTFYIENDMIRFNGKYILDTQDTILNENVEFSAPILDGKFTLNLENVTKYESGFYTYVTTLNGELKSDKLEGTYSTYYNNSHIGENKTWEVSY